MRDTLYSSQNYFNDWKIKKKKKKRIPKFSNIKEMLFLEQQFKVR